MVAGQRFERCAFDYGDERQRLLLAANYEIILKIDLVSLSGSIPAPSWSFGPGPRQRPFDLAPL